MNKITETEVAEPFGEYFRMDSLRKDYGAYPQAIIVATWSTAGIKPRQLMLPHQLYVRDAQALLSETSDTELWVHPIYEENFHDAWTQVEVPQVERKKPTRTQILPGDLVEHIEKDLDARPVISIGIDWLTLDILGTETERLPQANYRIVRHGEMLR